VSLAAVNRLRLTPRLALQDDGALRLLRRNAMLETAIGVAVVCIVAVLGTTIPAAHQSTDRMPMASSESHTH
jgi:putative copper export protein